MVFLLQEVGDGITESDKQKARKDIDELHFINVELFKLLALDREIFNRLGFKFDAQSIDRFLYDETTLRKEINDLLGT